MDFLNTIFTQNCLIGMKKLPEQSVNCCVTSPPYYGLRDYGNDEQIGLEETPEHYVQTMVNVFRDVKRVLRDDGTLWLNLGDSYAGGGKKGDTEGAKQKTSKGATWGNNDRLATLKSKIDGIKPKDLIGIPWMVAFALRADGWYLRSDIIWHKRNPMPESVTDRPTKAHEYIFLLSKSNQYYYDADAIAEKTTTFENRPAGVERNRTMDYNSKENLHPEAYRKKTKSTFGNRNGELNLLHSGKEYFDTGFKNKRSVWSLNSKPYPEAHFATYPEKLIEPCIKAGCPEGGIVLDPFMGAGTTAVVSRKLNRNYVGYELNDSYVKIAEKRLYNELGMFL